MITQSLTEAGGVSYLVEQARASPAAYLALVGKIIPLQVTGEDGKAIAHELMVTYRLPENER